jgi:uncharacterized protein YjbJ (UPF0337 family)
MRMGTIDLNKLRGFGDKAVGLGKELVGTVLGDEKLQEAGEAQQERATEQLRALRSELKAQEHEAKAETYEKRQQAAARAK